MRSRVSTLLERDLKAAARAETLVLTAGEPSVAITLKPAADALAMIEPIGPEAYRDLVRQALAEDRGRGDATSAATIAQGHSRARHHRRQVRPRRRRSRRGGRGLSAARSAGGLRSRLGRRLARPARRRRGADVRGDAHALLEAERTALNFLQRLSGIATLTAKFVDAARGGITILDTRKTTPGWRALEKYAVRCGGGTNHRQRLDDGILIKDNHKRLGGGVAAAATRAMQQSGGLPVVVEVETLDELDEVLQTGVPAHPARQLHHLRHSRSGDPRERAGRSSRSPAASRSSGFRSWPPPARSTCRSAR